MHVCSDVCHQHLCLNEQFGHFIECNDYFLVCLQIHAVDVRKGPWIISKYKINRSVNQSITHDQSINGDLLMTGGGNFEREERFRGEVQKRYNNQVGWVEIDRQPSYACGCVYTQPHAYDACVCLCVSRRVFVCVCACFFVRACICVHERTYIQSLFMTLNFAYSSQNIYQILSSPDFGQFHKRGSCSLKQTILSDLLVSFRPFFTI